MKTIKILSIVLAINISAKQAKLVDIQTIEPSIQVDLVFSNGANPIIDIPVVMYPANVKCYICEEAAYVLKDIQKELKSYGYGLKIRDGYRPMWAQKRLWEEVKKLNLQNPERYISDPVVEGGRHTRGTAVDLTLIDLATNKELPLPPFRFAEVSHRDYDGPLLNAEQIQNRSLLQSIMCKNGFSTIRAEWWHFDYKEWKDYEPLNISFEQLMNN